MKPILAILFFFGLGIRPAFSQKLALQVHNSYVSITDMSSRCFIGDAVYKLDDRFICATFDQPALTNDSCARYENGQEMQERSMRSLKSNEIVEGFEFIHSVDMFLAGQSTSSPVINKNKRSYSLVHHLNIGRLKLSKESIECLKNQDPKASDLYVRSVNFIPAGAELAGFISEVNLGASLVIGTKAVCPLEDKKCVLKKKKHLTANTLIKGGGNQVFTRMMLAAIQAKNPAEVTAALTSAMENITVPSVISFKIEDFSDL